MFTFPFGFMGAVAGGSSDAELVTNVSLTGQDIRLGQAPISLTGLESETYDYYGTLRINISTGAGALIPRFNGSLVNFEDIQMAAQGTSASGSTGTTNAPTMTIIDDTSILFNFSITGTIAGSRILSYQTGYRLNATDGMRNGKEVWSDTVNEITSFDLYSTETDTFDYDYIMYRVPKVGNQGNWEFVDSLEWAAEATPKSFTGLSLDTDKEYRVSTEVIADTFNWLRFNGDSGNNYDNAQLKVSGSSLTGNSDAAQSQIVVSDTYDITIRGQSGAPRSVLGNLIGATNVFEEVSGSYNNTVDDIDEISLNELFTNATATANLYKAKDGLTGDAMPFELVEERVLVAADIRNSPEVFSSLVGDSVDIFKIDFLLTSTTTTGIEIGNFNSDSNASNYNLNALRQQGNSIDAEVEANSNISLGKSSTSIPFNATVYIYPKSGTERPLLIRSSGNNAGFELQDISHAYWKNTASEMSTFHIRGSSTTSIVSGTIRLSKLIAN